MQTRSCTTALMFLVSAAAACSDRSAPGSSSGSAATSAQAREEGAPLGDATKTFGGSIKTYDDKLYNFSISLAERFAETKPLSTETMKRFDAKGEDGVDGITITIMQTRQVLLKDSVELAVGLDEKVLQSEPRPGGYVLVTEADGSLKLEFVITSGESSFRCNATAGGERVLDQRAKLIPALESMCSSLKIKDS
jgi:hypothetical protein